MLSRDLSYMGSHGRLGSSGFCFGPTFGSHHSGARKSEAVSFGSSELGLAKLSGCLLG